MGYEETEGGIKAIPGRLFTGGVDVLDLVKGKKESHFGYEEACFFCCSDTCRRKLNWKISAMW